MSRPSDGSASTTGSFSFNHPPLGTNRPITAPLAASSSHPVNPRASTAPAQTSSDQNVRVVARVRPLSNKELNEQSAECIRANPSNGEIRITSDGQAADGKRRFEFDCVFGPLTTQEEVYRGTCGGMVRDSIYKGFNGTILAYGQTGSGKTFTMGTDGGNTINNNMSDELAPPSAADGVIVRAVHDLFHIRSSLPSGPERVKVEMSYLEIYNEQAIDLLSDDPSSTTLQVRDSKTEGVVVQNLKSFAVSSPADVRRLMAQASANRATGATQMNAVSSRSHAICTLNVTIAPLHDGGDEENAGPNSSQEMMRAKLTLVDLAGSERIKKTGAEGARMKEGININKGLFVLGQVVSALSELGQMQGCGKKSNAHIPYRDSKLTRLLQDSLGGNSRTVMIACISPAESNTEETINTLRYAERTRNIKNSAVRNVVTGGLSAAEAASLRKENQQLKLELAQLRDGSLPLSGTSAIRTLPALASAEAADRYKAQCSSLLAENDLLKERVGAHADEVLEASLRADKWQAKFENLVQITKDQGIDLTDKIDSNEAEDIVSQLRQQLSECKAELLEARADAAVARATAGAIIAGKGDFASVSESLSTAENSVPETDDDFQQELLTNELSTVSGTIEQKEAMLQQMLKERSCRENIQIHLENSLRLLQSEVADLTAERNQLTEQMNKDMEDNSRRKCKTAVNPVTKKLRDQIKSLNDQIEELKRKETEQKKSLKMKEEAEKKCARLAAEIAQDKRRRAELQKKLKDASNEIRAEKKVARQNAARLMKDSQKLKIELSKIKSVAEKQAVVLKRKVEEAAAKEKARVELEKKRKTVERMRLASSAADAGEIKDSRKQELEAWIDREMQCSIIKTKTNDYKQQLESAMAKRKRLLKSQRDTVDIVELESIEDDCSAIRAAIEDLEATARKAFPAFEGSNPLWRFVDSDTFKALSKQEAKHVVTYVFDECSSVKHELDSVVANQETSTQLAIDAAVAKERQVHERSMMRLKMEHGEETLNLLQSTQGAVSSNLMEMLASNGDESVKTQLESTLDAYMQRCMSTEKRFKSDLSEMKESEEGMQKMMEDVTQGISFVPATARKPKKRTSYESEESFDVLDESFEIEVDDGSDYEPTPKPARKKRTAKRPQPVDSPLFGEGILDEEQLNGLTVQKLRQICKTNNLPTTGKKSELQGRLREKLFKPLSCKKVIFEEDASDIAADQDVSFEEEKPAAENIKKQLWQDADEDDTTCEAKPKAGSEPKAKAGNAFFRSLMNDSPAKSTKSASLPTTTRPSTAPLPVSTPSKMLGKSPKRKRSPSDYADIAHTPGTSAKKLRPLGFLTSSPRLSPSPPVAVAPLGSHNRTPVMFKHTVSTAKKRLIAKRPGVDTKITSSIKKKSKRGMNAAVHKALEQLGGL